MMGLGHLWRPRKFAIASIARIGTFPCKLPLAVLTHGLGRGFKSMMAQTKKTTARVIFLVWGE